MEGRPPPPPPPDSRPEVPYEEGRPATLAELRTLRRWLAVAGVWAVAASAIAIIALLEATKEPSGPRAVTGSQLARVQRGLDERIDELESQVEKLPSSADVTKLERRLKRVEDAASNTRDDVKGLNGDLDDLQQRVDDLEQQSTTPESGTDTETAP